MNKIIKVGKIPGKLVQVALEDNVNYTAKQVFDLANIDIDENYTINDGSSKIGLNDIVNGSILVASAKIKGNAGRIVKVGKIPGKLVQIALEDNVNYTAKQVFDLANIDIDENYTINDGSSKIGLNDTINGSILVASAKIKGNAGRIVKVGKIPGKLVQIALEDNVNYTAKQVFDLANIDIDENYTINDGSSKIGLSDIVNGSILVASAKIKGNLDIYSLKEYLDTNDFISLPEEMLDGKFNIIENTYNLVTLEDIKTRESFAIDKSLFENLFEVVNEDFISNCNSQSTHLTLGEYAKNLDKEDAFKRYIKYKINSLENDINEYNLKISNARKQIDCLQAILMN